MDHNLPEGLEYLGPYLEHMPELDDQTLIVLRGHLVIESKLDEIIERYLPNPQHLGSARLSFSQRLQIARAMCWTHHDSDVWPILSSINVLRNDLAHNLESQKLEGRLKAFDDRFFESIEHEELRKLVEAQDQNGRLRYGAAYVLGFLGRFHLDVDAFRTGTDALKAVIQMARVTGDEDLLDEETVTQ